MRVLDDQRRRGAQDLAYDPDVQRRLACYIGAALDTGFAQLLDHALESQAVQLQLLIPRGIANEQLDACAEGASQLPCPGQRRLLGCGGVEDDQDMSWRFHEAYLAGASCQRPGPRGILICRSAIAENT